MKKKKNFFKDTWGNLKVIGKNISKATKDLEKGFENVVDQDKKAVDKERKFKTVDEIMRDLPQ